MKKLLSILLLLLLSITFSFAQTTIDQGVKEVTINFPIGGITYSATPPPGKITITGSDGGGGTGSTVDYPGGKDYQFTDSNGNIWTVDENGTVTQGGKVAEGGASNSTNTDGITGSGNNATVNQYTAKGIKIEWKENAGGQFAYDTAEKTKLPKDKYPSVKDSDNNTVYVPYKATVNKQTELFDAKVSITDPTLKDAKIIFKTLSVGKAIEATELNKTDTERNYQLKLVGAFDYAEEEVIAVLMPKDSKDKQQIISSFRLVHLSPKTVDVSLVPLDNNSQSKLQSQGDKLNQIYKKIGINFNVKKEPVLDVSSIVSGDTINSEDADLMSTYSPQQQQINALYKGTDARYVLFVTNKKSSTGQKGYMRLNGQFGYVYNNAQDKTGAHELGHGVFKLEHPWKAYGTPQSATPLLMDYSTGEELSHLDWKQINDPAFKLYAFQNQSSGESSLFFGTLDESISSSINPPAENSCLKFAIGNGKFVTFDSNTYSNLSGINIENGILKSVTLKENNTLGKTSGIYTFSVSYKTVGSTPEGTPIVKLAYTSDLVCGDCIKTDSAIPKNKNFDSTGKEVTTWSGNKVPSKYILAKEDKYTNCNTGICVITGIDNNNFTTKILSQADCDQYNDGNSSSNSNLENCEGLRYTTVIISQHETDIKNKINSVKSLTVNENTPISSKKYVHKLGDYSLYKADVLDILEDRFRLLNQYTGKNIYFIPFSMPSQEDGKQYFYDKLTVNKLAKDVFESSGLGDNDVLIVFPFDGREDTRCLPLGIAKKGSNVLRDQDIEALTGNWDTKVLKLFSNVEKPLIVNSYYLTATGRLVQFSNKSSGNVRGYAAIKVLQFFESKGYAEIKQINQEINNHNTGIVDPQSGMPLPCNEVWSCYKPYLDQANALYIKYTNLELKQGAFQNKDIWNKISTDDLGKFREPFMDKVELTNRLWTDSKEKWTWGSKFQIAINNSTLQADKHFYNFSKLAVLDDVLYATLDGIGTIPGFDTFTDPVGAVYSGVRGNTENAIIYSASFAIPFAGSAYLKGGLHEAKEAGELWGIIAKKADNTDGFILDVKKVSDIQADEFHISSITYANEKELAEKIKTAALDDANNFIDKKTVRSAVNELAHNVGTVIKQSENLLSVNWKNNVKGYLSSIDAKTFWNDTSKNFSHYIDGDFYLKFDETTGNLLFANHKTGEILGFYEGAVNSSIITEKGGLQNVLGKLKIYHGVSGAPSYVMSNLSSGAKIISNPNKTATIVGNYTRYPYTVGDMKTLVGEELLGNLKTSQFSAKKGGFNVLNVSDEAIASHGGFNEFWDKFNRPWLDEAITRGDDIWAASNPLELNLLFKDLSLVPVNSLKTSEALANYLKNLNDPAVLNKITGFGKETQVLSQNGYIYNSTTKMFVK